MSAPLTPNPSALRQLSEHERAIFIEAAQHLTLSELADYFSISPVAVRYRLDRLGINPRRGKRQLPRDNRCPIYRVGRPFMWEREPALKAVEDLV